MKIALLFKNCCKTISTIVLIYSIQACGGGSSGSSSDTNQPIEFTFNLSSVLKNNCGVTQPFTNIELLLQDNDWQTIQSYSPNENGQITFNTSNARINYTLVAKNQVGEQVEGLVIQSYYQADASSEVTYNAQHDALVDQSSCECIIQDVELTHRAFASRSQVTSSLTFSEWQAIDDRTTLFKQVAVCRENQATWPLHSFSVVGLDINQTEIGSAAFSEDFETEVGTMLAFAAFDVAQLIDLPQQHQAFDSQQVIRETAHFSLSVDEDQSSLMLFNSHDFINETAYQSVAKVTFQETSSIFGSSVIESQHQIISANYDDSFSVAAATEKPNIDDINFSEIQADGSYDYSAVRQHPMAIIRFNYEVFDSQTQLLVPVSWTTYGEIAGQLPIYSSLPGYQDIINNDSDWYELNVQLVQSGSSQNYNDYIGYFQTPIADVFVNNLKSYQINITK